FFGDLWLGRCVVQGSKISLHHHGDALCGRLAVPLRQRQLARELKLSVGVEELDAYDGLIARVVDGVPEAVRFAFGVRNGSDAGEHGRAGARQVRTEGVRRTALDHQPMRCSQPEPRPTPHRETGTRAKARARPPSASPRWPGAGTTRALGS